MIYKLNCNIKYGFVSDEKKYDYLFSSFMFTKHLNTQILIYILLIK